MQRRNRYGMDLVLMILHEWTMQEIEVSDMYCTIQVQYNTSASIRVEYFNTTLMHQLLSLQISAHFVFKINGFCDDLHSYVRQ